MHYEDETFKTISPFVYLSFRQICNIGVKRRLHKSHFIFRPKNVQIACTGTDINKTFSAFRVFVGRQARGVLSDSNGHKMD